jgi:hypothetical protein
LAWVFVISASSASFAINSALFMILFLMILVTGQIYTVFHTSKKNL